MNATIDTTKPMGAARYVRRERYAFPGGYALALVTADGGTLCPACVASEFHQISAAHRARVNDGWRPRAVLCEAETDSAYTCDHCGRVIWEAKADEADEADEAREEQAARDAIPARLAHALAHVLPFVPFDGLHEDEKTKGKLLREARAALADYLDALLEDEGKRELNPVEVQILREAGSHG